MKIHEETNTPGCQGDTIPTAPKSFPLHSYTHERTQTCATGEFPLRRANAGNSSVLCLAVMCLASVT